MSEDFKDYYAILNIPPNADQELINEAYRKLSSFTHPDRQPEERKKWAEERQKDLNEAYDILKDPEKRKEYDEQYKLYQEFLSRFRDEIEKNAQRDVDNKANERSHTYSQSSDKPVGCIGRLFTWLFILFILGIISHTIKYCSRNENTIQNSSNKTNSSIIYDATNNTNSSMAAA
ncbi:MAG: J domain-containing protein, partial [bacterium]